MTTAEIAELGDHYAQEFPEQWRRVYPRFYESPHGYLSVKTVATLHFGNWLGYVLTEAQDRGSAADGIQCAHQLTIYLAKYSMPTFYVAPALLEALLQSDLPDDMLWTDIQMPMPCATFMLPLGKFCHPVDGPVGVISYARYRKGEIIMDPLSTRQHKTQVMEDIFCVCATAHEPEKPPLFHMVFNDTFKYVSQRRIREADMPTQDSGTWYIPTTEADHDFNDIMTSLAFRLIMAMHAKPELVSRGVSTHKRMRHGQEIWTPNFIGRNYVCKRSTTAEATGIHPRTHWRRGHLRQQHHGPQNSLLKTIWIEPVMVNA